MSTPVEVGGRWAALSRTLAGPATISLTGWLSTIVPAAVLVIVQEAATPFPSFLLVLGSALVQQAVDGVLALLALGLQRAAPRLDRLLIRVGLWTAIGIGRGLVGGAWAVAFAGVPADVGFRVVFWLALTWAWMPTIGYTIAQLEARRALLGLRDAESRALADAVGDDDARQGDLHSQLLEALHVSVSPAVEEVKLRLSGSGSALDAAATREIGARITGILDETSRIVRGTSRAVPRPPADPGRRVSVWAAIAETQRRPFRTAGVMAFGMAILLLPWAVRGAGPIATVPVLSGIATSVVVVVVAGLLERRATVRVAPLPVLGFVLRVLGAGAAGALTMLVVGELMRTDVVATAVLLPVVAGLGAAIVPTIVGIRAANDAVRAEISRLADERRRLVECGEREEQQVRSHVAQLLHGPIQGRLSACAMALSFHAAAAPAPDQERTAFITTSVLEHLDAVARDLEALADGRDLSSSPPPTGG